MKVRKDESVTRISKEVELDSNSWVSGRLDGRVQGSSSLLPTQLVREDQL